MELDKSVFGKKKLEDLLKEIYEYHKNKAKSINDEIVRISSFIESPGDAIALSPILKGLYDSSIKNDETLMKLAQLFKQSGENKGDDGSGGLLSEKDIAQLFDEVSSTKSSKLLDIK